MARVTRDTIVIGTSAGGVEALPRLIAQLEPPFPASLLIVQHLAALRDPYLVHIIRRTAKLPVVWAEQGARIEPGRAYVAPPDFHMVIQDNHLRLAAGPRENHARPSIDRLFLSAAATRAPRTIGVILTGMLNDGVAGLRAIREAGGYTIVQAPDDAAYPELPAQAVIGAAPDVILPLDAIGPALIAAVQPIQLAHAR